METYRIISMTSKTYGGDKKAVIEKTFDDGEKTYYITLELTPSEVDELDNMTSNDLKSYVNSNDVDECDDLARIIDGLNDAVCNYNADPFAAGDCWEEVVLQVAEDGCRLDPDPCPEALDIEESDAANWTYYISGGGSSAMTFAIPKK